MSKRIPEDERTLRLGEAYQNYLEEAKEIDEAALYACEHNFVIPEGDEFLCKDCNETFAQHPADLINPIPVGEPFLSEDPKDYVLASGVVNQQATYHFPVINQVPPQTILASGISNSSFANFAKPLMQVIFPKEIADEL